MADEQKITGVIQDNGVLETEGGRWFPEDAIKKLRRENGNRRINNKDLKEFRETTLEAFGLDDSENPMDDLKEMGTNLKDMKGANEKLESENDKLHKLQKVHAIAQKNKLDVSLTASLMQSEGLLDEPDLEGAVVKLAEEHSNLRLKQPPKRMGVHSNGGSDSGEMSMNDWIRGQK